jgi:hypothetical protein
MRPHECALIVAAPLTREEFLADLDGGSDFLHLFATQHPLLSRDGLVNLYEASAGEVRRAIGRCRSLGATVITRAILADFRDAVAKFPAVTVVAHWRSALFRVGDIVDPETVRVALAPLHAGMASISSCAALVEWMNQWILTGAGPADDAGQDGARRAAEETARQRVMHERRQRLEAFTNGAVRGGAGVEFVDGMAPLPAVVASVPAGFTGTLDLTVCNSTLLAEEVRRRCASGVILSNAFPARLDVRLQFYRAALELMARRPMSYADAVVAVRRKVRGMT